MECIGALPRHRFRLFRLQWIALVALPIAASGSRAIASVPAAVIDARMNAAVAAHREIGIGLAILENGDVAYEKAYGLRDVRRALPATTSTQYEIGSVTKEMTAAAVMQLVDAGTVSLDATLDRYLPNAPFASAVTVRELLSMTSGMPEYLTGPRLLTEVRSSTTPAQLLDRIAGKPLNFQPGSRWQHSNTNYLLLGELIERVSGEPYARYISDRVLARAPGAAFERMSRESQAPEMAVGYASGAAAPRLDETWVGPAGDLVGTLDDMIAWDRALAARDVVSRRSYDAMTSLQTPPTSMVAYGFGFFVDTYRNRKRIWQDGSTFAYNVCDEYFPDQRLRVIVFTNDNDGTSYADTLAEQVFDAIVPDGR